MTGTGRGLRAASPAAVRLFAACAIAAAFAGPAGATQATRLLWQAQGAGSIQAAEPIEDLDGDGVTDVVFESYENGPSGVEHVFAISGASSGAGTVIWSARPIGGLSSGGGDGDYCLQTSPDLTGDGVTDVLLGTAWGGRTAYMLDGSTGETVWSFDTYHDSPPTPPQGGWVYAHTSLGSDLNGDGRLEALFCAGSDNHCVYCADGGTGEILWHFRAVDAFMNVISIADVDGDDVRDVAALESDNHKTIYVFSGAGGPGGQADLIWSQPLQGSPWNACEIERPGEPATLAIALWDNTLKGYDAATGQLRFNANIGEYVMRVAPIDDVDGDGVDDLLVGSWDNAGRVHSGADGSQIWRTAVGTFNGGDCWSCATIGDTNGDGHEDAIFGSFDRNVYLMDGVSGAILWSYFVGNRVFTVRAIPDVTGNGIDEVLAGTQWPTSGPGGVCFLLEGNDDVAPQAIGDPTDPATAALRASPSPAAGAVRWTISLEAPAGRAALEVYDVAGRLVRILDAGAVPAGEHTTLWDGRDSQGGPLPAGIYLGRFTTDGRTIGARRVVRLP